MINLSFDELRLIAQNRNISDYENKSKEDLIKALSEPKPETPNQDTKPKPETPKQDTKLSESEIKKINRSFTKFEKTLRFKKFHGNIDSTDYEDLDNYGYNYYFADDDDEYRKIGSIRTLFKE